MPRDFRNKKTGCWEGAAYKIANDFQLRLPEMLFSWASCTLPLGELELSVGRETKENGEEGRKYVGLVVVHLLLALCV